MCAAQPALSNFVPATDVSVAKRAGSKSRLSDGSSGGGGFPSVARCGGYMHAMTLCPMH